MSDEINQERRHFLGAASMTIAASRFDAIGSAAAQTIKANPASIPM